MAIKVRLVGFGGDFTHYESVIFSDSIPKGRDVVFVNGEEYDVLIYNCDEIYRQDNAFYVKGIKKSLAEHSGKTLLISGENAAEIQHLPFFIQQVIYLIDEFNLRFFSKIPFMKKMSSKITLLLIGRVVVFFFKALKFLNKFFWFFTWKVGSPYRPDFTEYVRNSLGPRHYAILTNRERSNRQENVLHYPYFLHSSPVKGERFVEIKRKGLFEQKKRFCAFVSSNATGGFLAQLRAFFCAELAKYKRVDCYGPVLKNETIPKELLSKYSEKKVNLDHFTEGDIDRACSTGYHLDTGVIYRSQLNQELFRDYKFVICFENSVAEDYITEKLPNVMLGNSIGIYYGAPNVGEYFNPKSFINYGDYNDYKAVIKRVIELDRDDEEYLKVLREPFFVGNRVPRTILDKEEELKHFLDKVFTEEK